MLELLSAIFDTALTKEFSELSMSQMEISCSENESGQESIGKYRTTPFGTPVIKFNSQLSGSSDESGKYDLMELSKTLE